MLHVIVLLLSLASPGAQDFELLQIEQIADGFLGGEGSVWSREGFLLFSDVPSNRILTLRSQMLAGAVVATCVVP